MKRLFILVILAVVSTAIYAQQSNAITEYATVKWNEVSHDFGKVKQNVPAVFEFKCTNVGTVPLQFYGVSRSYDCTIPEWTSKAIKPGETGIVKVSFNAKYSGYFSKTITVKANVQSGVIELTLTGEVVPEPTE